MAARGRSVMTKETEPQGFTKVTDPLELHRFLKRAIEIAAKVEVRLPDLKIEFQSVIHESSDIEKGFRIEVPSDVTDESMKESPSGAMLIAFMRGQNLLCIHSQSAEWKDRVLTVSPPWAVFKVQRRKEPRYQIPAAYEMFVSMESVEGTRRRVQKRVLDISEQGMGFQVASMREAAPYRKGMFLRKMEVVIEHRQIFFDARVANALPIGADNPHLSGVKIGIEVIRMSPLDRQFIAAYVARNLVQIYT